MSRRRPAPGTAPDARGAFLQAVHFPLGEFIETQHFRDEMANEGFDRNDVRRLAHQGRMVPLPRWDVTHREWKWRIEGETVDGRRCALIFTVLGPRRVKAITAFGMRRPR